MLRLKSPSALLHEAVPSSLVFSDKVFFAIFASLRETFPVVLARNFRDPKVSNVRQFDPCAVCINL